MSIAICQIESVDSSGNNGIVHAKGNIYNTLWSYGYRPYGLTLDSYHTTKHILVGDEKSESVIQIPTTSVNGGTDKMTNLKIFPKLGQPTRLTTKEKRKKGSSVLIRVPDVVRRQTLFVFQSTALVL